MKNGEKAQQLGQYIKTRRESLGMSVAQAAEASDMHRSYWNKLEAGQYESPSPRHLHTIADVLKVSIADLYALVGYPIAEGLPTFNAYLRSTGYLAPEAIAQLESYFSFLRAQYGIPDDQPVFPPKPSADETTNVDPENDRSAA